MREHFFFKYFHFAFAILLIIAGSLAQKLLHSLRLFAGFFLYVKMRAITKGRCMRTLTITDCHLFFFSHLEYLWFVFGSFMGAVTEWLFFRLSTSAPIVSAWFQRNNNGHLFFHVMFLPWKVIIFFYNKAKNDISSSIFIIFPLKHSILKQSNH